MRCGAWSAVICSRSSSPAPSRSRPATTGKGALRRHPSSSASSKRLACEATESRRTVFTSRPSIWRGSIAYFVVRVALLHVRRREHLVPGPPRRLEAGDARIAAAPPQPRRQGVEIERAHRTFQFLGKYSPAPSVNSVRDRQRVIQSLPRATSIGLFPNPRPRSHRVVFLSDASPSCPQARAGPS